MDSNETTGVKVFDIEMRVPTTYTKGYAHQNLYPYRVPGEHCYGGRDEQLVQLHMASIMTGNDVFVDVGAGCGSYCMLATRLGAKEIHAFEPAPGIYELLAENLTENRKVADAVPHNVALLNEHCDAYMGAWGTWDIRLYQGPGKNLVKIETALLDDFELPADIVKIDVEGNAPAVLAGGRQTIAGARAVFIETHNEYEDARCCMQLVSAFGFTTQRISETYIMGWK